MSIIEKPVRDRDGVAVIPLQGPDAPAPCTAAEIVHAASPRPGQPGSWQQPVLARQPEGLRAFWREHKKPLTTAAWVFGTDLTAFAAHAAGGPNAYLGVLALSAAAGSRVAWNFRPKKKRRRAARRYAAAMWAASTATALTGTWAGVSTGPAQVALLAGGFAAGGKYLWDNRKRPPRGPEPEPVPALPPPEDPRLAKFRNRFCHGGPCKDAELTHFEEIPGGFAFEVHLTEESGATTDSVIGLRNQIAALYDIPAHQVTVEYARSKESERRARIIVLAREKAHTRESRWDGQPTYDPKTGCAQIGRFADDSQQHWEFHRPGSGATGGIISGQPGAGKSGTVHVIACEGGQAKLCKACGGEGTCPRCQPRRILDIWMGDAQGQGMSVWHRRAGVTALGPPACVVMMQWAVAGMNARSAYFRNVEWTDHLGRVNRGRGWYDADPEHPIVYVMLDEWPKVVKDKALFKIALPLALALVLEGRKVGVIPVFVTQMPDVAEIGDRVIREPLKAFNVLSHRTDGLSDSMIGIRGDTSKLAHGVHGLSYVSGVDQRPGTVGRTKHIREYLWPGETGVDVREIAERVADDPVTLDQCFLDAIRPLGYTGPGCVIEADRETVLTGAVPELTPQAAQARGAQDRGDAAPASEAPPQPVNLSLLAGLLAHRGQMDLYEVMQAADCDAFEADKALLALAEVGVAAPLGGDRYAAANGRAAS